MSSYIVTDDVDECIFLVVHLNLYISMYYYRKKLATNWLFLMKKFGSSKLKFVKSKWLLRVEEKYLRLFLFFMFWFLFNFWRCSLAISDGILLLELWSTLLESQSLVYFLFKILECPNREWKKSSMK